MSRTKIEMQELLDKLPPHLAERAFLRAEGRSGHAGEFVLYWTHHALRVDENPALDVASLFAEVLDVPLVVYQGLSEGYRFSSDRHHTFILEAARELQVKYSKRGATYLLHLDRDGYRSPRLAKLAKSSVLMVTDDFPIEATRQWTDRIAEAKLCPVVSVDTACVVPTRLVGKAYERAFGFRDATAKLHRERVDKLWPECFVSTKNARSPFESLELGNTSIAELVATCNIDHSIGPVADTRGGSDAGYARWKRFRNGGLRNYAKRRNQIEMDGVSRMSAYLHYGMVSPMRIAREASEDGAEKYLDELLIWRELAYAFCHYRSELETDSSLPAWAIATLVEHGRDARVCLSWESLARAKTGQPLWDASQRSLLKHGELHNNIRMTWGKAILEWSTDHREAMKRIIDLNHRYALDGRDPASYGGILWCLGQFDRPFYPEQPIFGSVRTRPLADHEARTNLEAYVEKVDRVTYHPVPRIAMVGTGLAGIVCCRILNDHGLRTKSFEKSNRAGGRLSTRVADAVMQFDHGAQYFTVRDPVLTPYLDSWRSDGCVGLWDGRIVAIDKPGLFSEVPLTQRYVGTPKMESLAEHLSSELTIETDTEVARVERTTSGYELSAKDGRKLGEFDVVLWNCPPRQVEKMVPSQCEWFDELKKVEMVPCWAVMVAFEGRWEVPFDGAFVNCGGIAWVARNSSKPSRSKELDTWVLHSSVAWAKENLEATKDDVASVLIGEAEKVASLKMPKQIVAKAHRWLYSKPDESLPREFLWDDKNRLGACGDWCGGPRVEGALKSGMALAGRLLGSLHEQKNANAVDNMTSTETIQLKLF